MKWGDDEQRVNTLRVAFSLCREDKQETKTDDDRLLLLLLLWLLLE